MHRKADMPFWARHFESGEDVERFLSLVELYFRRRKLPITIEDGVVMGLGPIDGRQYSLLKPSQMCVPARKDEWPAVIAHYFDVMDRVTSLDPAAHAELTNYDWCSPRLVVRLYEGESVPFASELVARSDIPGLTTVLALHLPEAFHTLREDRVRHWPGGPDDWFRLALENRHRTPAPQSHELDTGADEPVRLLECQDLIAAHALSLDDFPELLGTFGSFVGVPTASILAATRIQGPECFDRIAGLARLVDLICRDGPGSTSEAIYWVREGVWELVEVELGDDDVEVHPGPELQALLESFGVEGA